MYLYNTKARDSTSKQQFHTTPRTYSPLTTHPHDPHSAHPKPANYATPLARALRPLSSVQSDPGSGPAVNTSLGARVSQTTGGAERICDNDNDNDATTKRQDGERKAAGEYAAY